MKICILTHTFPRSDNDITAAFMDSFSTGLVEAGNEVFIVTPYDRKFSRRRDPFEIITYKYIWPDWLHILGYSKTMEADVALRKRAYFLLPFMLFFGTLTLLRQVRKKKPDLINVHWILPNGPMALIVSKITKTPYVVTVPGTDIYLAYKNKLFGLVAKYIAQNSAGITSNSSWLLKKTLKLGINPSMPTQVISYPANVSMFKPTAKDLGTYRKKLGLKKNDFVILAVGRLVYKKGFDYLIKATALLAKKYPQVKLVIGGDGDLKKEWRELSKNLGIEDKVLFVGSISRNDIAFYYNLANVFVAPSVVDKKGNVDGGPVVSFESMACGKPQIATSVLGVSDLIEDGINGFVVPQRNPQAIEMALMKLIKSDKLRKDMGQKNIQLARSLFDTKSVGENYTKFFKRTIRTFSWTPTPTFLYRNYLYRNMVKSLPKGSFFLDVGAGNGDFLRSLSGLGFKGEAIDVSQDAVSFAKERLGRAKGIKVKLADIFTYRPTRKYDVAFCFEVLEHIGDDKKAMQKIFNLLNPGGIFICSVPAHQSLWSKIDEVKGHYRRYEKVELKSKLRKAGFRVTSIYTYGFPFLSLLRRLSDSGKFVKSKTQHLDKDARGRESGIQEEYDPKLRKLVTNPILLYPFFKIMDLFTKTDFGFGYIIIATKDE